MGGANVQSACGTTRLNDYWNRQRAPASVQSARGRWRMRIYSKRRHPPRRAGFSAGDTAARLMRGASLRRANSSGVSQGKIQGRPRRHPAVPCVPAPRGLGGGRNVMSPPADLGACPPDSARFGRRGARAGWRFRWALFSETAGESIGVCGRWKTSVEKSVHSSGGANPDNVSDLIRQADAVDVLNLWRASLAVETRSRRCRRSFALPYRPLALDARRNQDSRGFRLPKARRLEPGARAVFHLLRRRQSSGFPLSRE